MAGDYPDRDARCPTGQGIDVRGGLVASGEIGDEKRWPNGEELELRQRLSNGLESFDAHAFLEQLGSKQGASLPLLAGQENLDHEHIIPCLNPES